MPAIWQAGEQFSFPGSQTLNAADIKQQWLDAGAPENVADAFANGLTQSEGSGRSGVLYNTAFPSLPGYTAPLSWAQPEYSVGMYGINVKGDLGVTDPQQAYKIGQALSNNPQYQTEVAAKMFSQRGFAPWEGDSFVKNLGGPTAALSHLGYSSPPGISGGVDLSANVPAGNGTGSGPPPAGGDGTSGGSPPPSTGKNVGGNPAIVVSGAKDWPAAEKIIKAQYPQWAWLLNYTGQKGQKSPASIIQQAVSEGRDKTWIEANLQQTQWWTNTANALRNYQKNIATNPANYAFDKAGSLAQQKAGDIALLAKNDGVLLPKGYTQNLALEALMYNWDDNQIKENVGALAATGVGQVYDPNYLTGQATQGPAYNFGTFGQQAGTDKAQTPGYLAQGAINAVRAAIAGQGYKPKDFDDAEVRTLAKQYLEFGWAQDPSSLAQAVIRVGAGGKGYVLSTDYTQGMLTTPDQYQFAGTSTVDGKQVQHGTGTIAAQALTNVRSALADAGKQEGGAGGVTDAQVHQLAQEYMMFGWRNDPDQLRMAINGLGKTGGGLLDPAYLHGIQTNLQQYEKGGEQYNAAQAAVQHALNVGGRTGIGTLAKQALIEEYMQQGWANNPQLLTDAVGQTKGAGSLDPNYLVGRQADPQQYQQGGFYYEQAKSAIEGAALAYGKKINPSDEPVLIQEYMQQGWQGQADTRLMDAIGGASGSSAYTSQFLTGWAQNPGQYLPGGPQYVAAQGVLAGALSNVGTLPNELTPAETETMLNGIMQQGWSGPVLEQELDAFTHKGPAYNSSYTAGLLANPQQWQFTLPGATDKKGNPVPQTIADQVLTQVETVMGGGQFPVSLSLAQAQQVAKLAMQGGGASPSDELIRSLAAKYVNVAQPTPPTYTTTPAAADGGRRGIMPAGTNTTPPQQVTQTSPGTPATPGMGGLATNAPGILQQLQQQAANYFVQPSAGVLQNYARQFAEGTSDQQAFDGYLAGQAAIKYPGMAPLISQGQQPTAIADYLRQLASNTLEVSPESVNFQDPHYAKLLDGGDGGGMMSTSDATTYLRNLPQYQYTNGARSQAASVEQAILQAFGRVG